MKLKKFSWLSSSFGVICSITHRYKYFWYKGNTVRFKSQSNESISFYSNWTFVCFCYSLDNRESKIATITIVSKDCSPFYYHKVILIPTLPCSSNNFTIYATLTKTYLLFQTILITMFLLMLYGALPSTQLKTHDTAVTPFKSSVGSFEKDPLETSESRFIGKYAPYYGYRKRLFKGRLFKIGPKRRFIFKKKKFWIFVVGAPT